MFADNESLFVCPKLKGIDVKCERDEYVKQHEHVKLGEYLITMHKLHDICLTCANKYEGK